MSEVRVDHKGKIFSVRMDKDTVRVIMATERHTIVGSVFVRPGNRPKDELNSEDMFIAVSDAQVFDQSGGNLLYKTHFVSVNKSQVLWALPTSELLDEHSAELTP